MRSTCGVFGQRFMVFMLFTICSCGNAMEAEPAFSDLEQLSLDELMTVVVTSASKKAEPLANATTAIYVITQEDIRRSGAASIPEALRLAPGLHVARIDGNKWAITARGFNGIYANKLLVLIDGRSVYNHTFSGVYWSLQEVIMDDIDRIEVIRGPGATMWGANAVNGVINIITKSAQQTQGGLLSLGSGTEHPGFGSIRYGFQWGEKSWARIYSQGYVSASGHDPAGHGVGDDADYLKQGFRWDWQPTKTDRLTLQGDYYQSDAGQAVFIPALNPFPGFYREEDTQTNGGNILGRWEKDIDDNQSLSLQLYYERYHRFGNSLIDITVDTVDIDFQHRLQLADRHDLIWGLGTRIIHDRYEDRELVSLVRHSDNLYNYSGFIQDDVTVVEKLFHVIVGVKIERDHYTDFEPQPSLRLLLTPTEKQTIWAAVSRAVRTPSRVEDDGRINFSYRPSSPLPRLITLNGNSDMAAETLIAWELGYRVQPRPKLSFDLTGFYHDYDHLRSLDLDPSMAFAEPRPPGQPSHIVLPFMVHNRMQGETYGGEAAVECKLLNRWSIKTSYSLAWTQLHAPKTSTDPQALNDEKNYPRQQLSLLSSLDLTAKIILNSWIRYVDGLPALGISDYLSLDLGLEWKPLPSLSVALVGQNLLDPGRPEYTSNFISYINTEVERGFYGKLTWRF